MSRILYISDHCNGCVQLAEKVQQEGLVCAVVNIDQEKNEVPHQVFVVPALVVDDKLLAYGADEILQFLRV